MPGDRPVQVCRRIIFSSGYRYWRDELSKDENLSLFGKQASRTGFGHNFVLEAVLEGTIDPRTGMVINLREVDSMLKQVVAPLDHHFLNTDVAFFSDRIPTPENIARYCYERLLGRLDGDKLSLRKVRLWQGEDLFVDYGELG